MRMPKKTVTSISLGTRLSCLLMEVSAAYGLSFVISPEKDLLMNLGELLLSSKDWGIFNFSIQTLLGLYLLTQLFRFSSQLFFGHGLFDPLFGLTTKGGYFAPRFLGGLKLVLDTILFPLIIFHLPLVYSNPTMIEKWSGFQKYQETTPGFFGHLGLFLTPLTVIISLYTPLIMGLTLFDGVEVSDEATKKLGAPKVDDLKSYEIYSSKLYGFKTLSSLGSGRFHLIPQFDLSRSQGRLKLTPHILIYDQRESVFLNFKLKATLRFGPLIQKSQQGMPFWNQKFPELSKTYSLLSFEQRSGKQAFVFKAPACREIKQLVRSSFELGLSSLIDHSFEYGPFLKGMVVLRRSLLSIVGAEIPPEVDLYELGDASFLRFRQLYDLPQRKSAIKQTLFPLCVTQSPVFALVSDSDLPSAISRKDFMAEFFGQSEWSFKEEATVTNPLPEKKEDINVFHLLDYAQWNKLDEVDLQKLEEGISYFYFDLAYKALSTSSVHGELKDEIEKSLTRMIDLLRLNKKKDHTHITSSLILYLRQTLDALKQENKSYFGLIQGSQQELWER